MNYKIIIGLLYGINLHVSGQITGGRSGLSIPSLSEILRDTGVLESAVVDLSRSGILGRGPQDGFPGGVPGVIRDGVQVGFRAGIPDGFVGATQDGFGRGIPDGFVGATQDGSGGSHGGPVGVAPGGFVSDSPGGPVGVAPGGFVGDSPGGHVGVAPGGFGDGIHGGLAGGGQNEFTPIDVSTAHVHGTDVHSVMSGVVGPTIITDIRGNVPPAPTGRHVDLPNEHGNIHNFAVVHHGEAPMQGPTHLDHTIHENIPVQQRTGSEMSAFHPDEQGQVHRHVDSTHTLNTVSNINPEHPFHGSNVHHGVLASGNTNFDNLAAMGNAGLGFKDSVVPSFSVADLLELPPGTPVITRDHINAPPLHVLADVPNPPRTSMSKSDGFFSPSDVVLPSSSGVHMDTQHAVLSREEPHRFGPHTGSPRGTTNVALSPGTQLRPAHFDLSGEHGPTVSGFPGAGPGPLPEPGQHASHLGIHFDEPKVHGNMLNEPALHLPPGATIEDARAAGVIPASTRDGPEPGTLIDTSITKQLPGTPTGTNSFGQQPGAPIGTNSFGQQPGAPIGSVHVDLPGQHGVPRDGHAVIHREGPQQFGQQPGSPIGTNSFGQQPGAPIGTNSFGQQPGAPIGGFHVENRNPQDGIVIHREGARTGSQIGAPLGNTHVNMPGQHGTRVDGVPTVHRDFGLIPDPLPRSRLLPGTMGIHSDAPGHTAGFGGIIPRLDPVYQTGVIPGTVNVPIPGTPNGHVLINRAGPDRMPVNLHGGRPRGRGRIIGDLLGIPPMRWSDSVGSNNFQRPSDVTNLASPFGVSHNHSGLRNLNGGLGGGRRWRPIARTSSITTSLAVPRHHGIAIFQPPWVSSSAISAGGLLGSVFRTMIGIQRGLDPATDIAPMRLHPVPTHGVIFTGR